MTYCRETTDPDDPLPPRSAMHRDTPTGSRLAIANAYAVGRLVEAVPVEMDIDEIVRELGDCVLHGSWGTGCDFDYAEARAIILRIGGDDE